MAIQAKYTQPLQVVHTAEVHARINAIAEREKISRAHVIRELIDTALPEREAESERLAGL